MTQDDDDRDALTAVAQLKGERPELHGLTKRKEEVAR